MTNGIQKLFAEYEKAFAALDIEKSAGFFADLSFPQALGVPLLKTRPSFLRWPMRQVNFTRESARHLRNPFTYRNPYQQ